jgi:hypothetical protein
LPTTDDKEFTKPYEIWQQAEAITDATTIKLVPYYTRETFLTSAGHTFRIPVIEVNRRGLAHIAPRYGDIFPHSVCTELEQQIRPIAEEFAEQQFTQIVNNVLNSVLGEQIEYIQNTIAELQDAKDAAQQALAEHNNQ